MKRIERVLFLIELLALREKLLEAFRQDVNALAQLRGVFLLGSERFHSSLGLADRCLENAKALIERFEILLLERQFLDVAADRFVERLAILCDSSELARQLFPSLRGSLQLATGLCG